MKRNVSSIKIILKWIILGFQIAYLAYMIRIMLNMLNMLYMMFFDKHIKCW